MDKQAINKHWQAIGAAYRDVDAAQQTLNTARDRLEQARAELGAALAAELYPGLAVGDYIGVTQKYGFQGKTRELIYRVHSFDIWVVGRPPYDPDDFHPRVMGRAVRKGDGMETGRMVEISMPNESNRGMIICWRRFGQTLSGDPVREQRTPDGVQSVADEEQPVGDLEPADRDRFGGGDDDVRP